MATFVETPPQATLIVEGVFLLRPEFRRHWHLAIYLHVPEYVTLERAVVRDLELFGSASAVQEHYNGRYLPGQREAARVDTKLHGLADADLPVLRVQPGVDGSC